MIIEPIAYYHSPLKGKFGLPRQAGLAPGLLGEVRFVPPYNAEEAVRGLEEFDYCWLIWGFSMRADSNSALTVRPPRLGGNKRVGVFASRSPFRPNGLGLSCVRVESVSGGVLRVSGADLADGTPIYDVKPYIEYSDSRPGAGSGFVDASPWEPLEVHIPQETALQLGPELAETLVQLLSQDPRPAYHHDAQRVYGIVLSGFEIKFRVDGEQVFVLSAEKC